MATTYEKVVAVISKASHLRQNKEINQLLPWFRKKSKLFHKLKTEILEDILRNCDFVSKKPDDIIILQGEQGNCFYIILRGKVTIYNLSKGDEENITQLTRAELKSDKNQLERPKLGNFVCHLATGDPFGEVALLSKDCIRTASVVADEYIDLMVVEKALYERSVQDVLTREFQQKIAFICANPLFHDWPHKYRHQLAMAVYKVALAYNEVLIAQGEATTCIYFVLRGQLEILCNPKQHVSQYPKLVLPENTDTRSKILKKQNSNKRYRATSLDHPLFCYEDGTSKVRNLRSRMRKDTAKVLRLYYLGVNEMIGDTEVLMDLDTSLQTAVSTERTELLVLEMKHYERLFARRHRQTVLAMYRLLELKYSRRLLMHDCEHLIPLLSHLGEKLKQSRKRKDHNNNKNKATHGCSSSKMDTLVTVSAMTTQIKDIESVQKKFLQHQGPIIDMYAPGSVFYLIQLREERRQKVKSRKAEYEPSWLASTSSQDGVISAKNDPTLKLQLESVPVVSEAEKSSKKQNDEQKYSELQKLEDSIKTWLQLDNPSNVVKIPQLRRLDPQSMKSKPKPGYKMHVRHQKTNRNIYDFDMEEAEEEAEEQKLEKWRFLLTD